jgi:urate oxidase
MTIELAASRYGKSSVRLLRVVRHPDRHEILELTVDVACSGELGAAYTEGDNSLVLPTDTMKNTVHAFAWEHPRAEMEELGLLLGRHFIAGNPQFDEVEIGLAARPWSRLEVAGQPHPHAFVEAGGERRTAAIAVSRQASTVGAGLDGVLVLKTTGSAFEGFPRDRFTTLPETRDRILATRLRAEWRYRAAGAGVDFGAAFAGVRGRLLETFAGHDSRSLQHTLYAMGEAVLERFPEVEEIGLRLPNRHYLLADLSRFGIANENQVFVATDEPHGLIEATLRRR